MDVAHWRATRQRRPRQQTIPVCADTELLDALSALRLSPPKQQKGQTPKKALEAWKAELDKLQADIAAATIQVVVQSIDADEYLDIKDQHRPTTQEARDRGDEWDGKTFWPALFVACIHPDSEVSQDAAPDFWSDLTAGEQQRIEQVLWGLNEQVPDLGFTMPDTTPTGGIGQPSTTAPPEE